MTLDLELVRRAKRAPVVQSMTWKECVAANLLHRERVKLAVLTRLFALSRNTIHYKALTRNAKGYLGSATETAVSGPEVNAYIDAVGLEEAKRPANSDYVLLTKQVNALNHQLAKRKDIPALKKIRATVR